MSNLLGALTIRPLQALATAGDSEKKFPHHHLPTPQNHSSVIFFSFFFFKGKVHIFNVRDEKG